MIKGISTILLSIGAVLMFIGFIPFVIEYPHSLAGGNSGPSNYWELIVMISYDSWFLELGLIIMLMGLFIKNSK